MRKSNLNCGILFLIILFFYPAANTAQPFGQQPFHKCWQLETDILRNINFASDNINILYLPLPAGIIKAVNVKDQNTDWQSEVGGEIASSPVLAGDSLYVISTDTNPAAADENSTSMTSTTSTLTTSAKKSFNLTALSVLTGIPRWKREFLADSDTLMIYVCAEGENLSVLTDHGMFYIVRRSDGGIISEKSLAVNVNLPPFLKDGILYIAGLNKVFKLESAAGQQNVTELKEIENTISALLPAAENLYLGDDFGIISKLRLRDNKILWKSRTGAEIGDITEVGDNLLVSSADNYVYLLSKKNGGRIWKKRLTGKNQGKLAVKEAVSVFSPLGERVVTFVETKKGKTVNQISLDEKDNPNFFTNSPTIIGNVVILSTLKGISAFSAENCGQPTIPPKK